MPSLAELLSQLQSRSDVLGVRELSRKTVDARRSLVDIEVEYIVSGVVYVEIVQAIVIQGGSGETAYWYGKKPAVLSIVDYTGFSSSIRSYMDGLVSSGGILRYVIEYEYPQHQVAEASIYMDDGAGGVVKRRALIYIDPATGRPTHRIITATQ